MAALRPRLDRPLFIALAALLLAAYFAVPARAAWPGREGPVVYAGVGPGAKEGSFVPIGLRSFTFGVAGSRTQLTADPSDRDPQVSPNGRLVVFSRVVRSVLGNEVSGIFVCGIDGNGLRQLTAGGPDDSADTQPNFDATGTRVVFARVGGSAEPNPRGDIYSVGLDGTGLTQITSGPADDDFPAVSPSGRQIAFVRTRYRPDGAESHAPRIYSIRPDGSRLRDLTPGIMQTRESPWDLDFSPSGRVIAFATNGNQLRGDIFTMRSNGGLIRRLTNGGHGPVFPRPFGYTNPTFSPAGDSILAVARNGSSGPRLARISLADPDHPHRLGPSFLGSAPAWAPRR